LSGQAAARKQFAIDNCGVPVNNQDAGQPSRTFDGAADGMLPHRLAITVIAMRVLFWLAPRGTRREQVLRLGKRALRVWRQEGLATLCRRAVKKIQRVDQSHSHDLATRTAQFETPLEQFSAGRARYEEWLEENRVTERVRGLLRAEMGTWSYRPTISLLMPVHDPPLPYLREAIESVRRQVYGQWELCLADDGSGPAVAQELQRWAEREARIKLVRSEENAGIAEATNRALGLAQGEFVGLLDHDDVLDETALYYVAQALNQDPTLDVLYTDKDHLTAQGRRVDPYFKPEWSAATLLSHNYVIHLLVCRKALVERVGGWRKEYDGAQDYDLILRVTEQTERIRHIPKVLYSWRRHGGSNSQAPKPAANAAGQRAVAAAVERRGGGGTVESTGPAGPYRVRYAVVGQPLVSIVISSCTVELLRACYGSVKARTRYWNYEVVVATNAVGSAELRGYCEAEGVRLVEVVEGFFSKMNNAAVEAARGEYVVFLNDDTEIVTPEWLEELLGWCQQPGVAAVGPKLISREGRVWLSRIMAGIRRDGRPYFFDPFTLFGVSFFYGFSADATYEVSSLTGACMMVKREVFLSSGGFDAEQFSYSFQDIDWCLRLRKQGYRFLYTPYAVIIHLGSSTKQQTPELLAREIPFANAFFKKHKDLLLHGDEFFNPNLADIGAFIEAPCFPGLDSINTTSVLYGRSYWESYGFPVVAKGHGVNNRLAAIKELLPLATSIRIATGCRKVIDVGCGLGIMVEALQSLGVHANGVESSREALDYIPPVVRERIQLGDLTSAEDMARLKNAGPFDVAICIEVLEHIPPDLVDTAIRNMAILADTLVVTTPQPNLWDREDPTHLCVMPRAFWVERFRQAGFVEDAEKGQRIFGKGFQSNPDRNAFVFTRS
jgi:GT2 family glycosyltransferase/SAM-dependent methyltransferase